MPLSLGQKSHQQRRFTHRIKDRLEPQLVSISRIRHLGKEFPISAAVTEIIGEDSEGQRIDNFLIKRLKDVPKSHIYQLLRSGQVRLNSKRIGADYHLQPGDAVRIPPVRTVERSFPPGKKLSKSRFIPFDVLFEDEALVVINKPSGVAVHGGSGVSFGVIEQLRAQHPDWKFLELVHRLDRETSGILLLAKSRAALVELHRQIREGMMEKRYLTLVKGKWRNARQSVKLSLNKYVTSTGERRVAVIADAREKKEGVTAHTVFNLKKSWRDFSLLEAELKTGRTHQIRVHLAHLGFPIAGDDKYGDFALNKELAKRANGPILARMFLHAFQVEVTHPVTGKKLHLEAPLPNDLSEFLLGLDAADKRVRS
ncbi:23S rRNA pseudouridine955/2504/2580 synthase [Nitrosovibrio sp. Nv6]|nr:23S rRNA pseudouridine955/2504/2580 synthase [Nitrosovibrio sp. Nv6]